MATGWSIALLIASVVGVGTYVAWQWAAHQGHRHTTRDDMYTRAFDAFVDRYGKTYTSPEERLKRFDVFKANYAFVQAQNAKGLSYTLEINSFADQTSQELSSTHLGLSAPAPEKSWNGVAYLGSDPYSGAPLPDSVDWTSKGGVTDVKNQKHCGSCWAFSSTGALEGAWFVATGKLVALSEQQLIDCDRDGELGCKGGSMQGAFKWLKEQQACTEESYSYAMEQGVCQGNCVAGIPLGGVKGYFDVPHDDEKALMEAVAQQPVSVAIEADQKSFQLYRSGVLTKECGAKLDHGVLLVGYGTEDGVDYWKVKNSWGPDWGEQGYVRIERGVKEEGECGINSQPVYPIVDAHPKPVPPSPVPPSPVPPSPPKPPAGKSYYEEPPCQSDEVEAKISYAEGSVVCAPPCTAFDTCPMDMPSGTTATPQCVLKDGENHQYCALVCRSGLGCPHGAKCADIGGAGICVYPEALSAAKVERLALEAKLADSVEAIAV